MNGPSGKLGKLAKGDWHPSMPFPKPNGTARAWISEIILPAIAAGPDDNILDIDLGRLQ
jgi:hypothetical protein